jgi:hypothetical protein
MKIRAELNTEPQIENLELPETILELQNLEIPEIPELDVEEATEEEITSEIRKVFSQNNPLATLALLSVLSQRKFPEQWGLPKNENNND